MSKETIQYLIFITMFYSGSSLTVEPQNVVVHENSKFEMVCCSSGEILSWNYFHHPSNRSSIHDGDSMARRYNSSGFSVKWNGSCSVLTHNSIQFEQSGIYGCIDDNSARDNTAHLLVLREGGMKCSSDETCNKFGVESRTSDISIQCLTVFNKLLEPVIKCKNAETESYKETIRGMEKTVENNFSLPIQDGSKNVSVTCEISYNITDQYPLMAKNSWSTTVPVSKQCNHYAPSENETSWTVVVVVVVVVVSVTLVALIVGFAIRKHIKKEKKPTTEEDQSIKVLLKNGGAKQDTSNNGKSGENTAANE